MSLTHDQDHSISLSTASEWTANYRGKYPNQIKGHAFGKDAIEAILAQDDCIGIRIYYALDDDGVQQLIITGVDSAGDDLYDGLLAERSMPCPPVCGSKNPLNS